jgi:hypothetical protein
MKQALVIALLLWAAFYFTVEILDFRLASAIGFAATSMIAAANCLTFLWLWYVRATPLALGMALAWGGQAALSSWWFVTGMPGKAAWLNQHPLIFLFLSVYMVGGALHISIVQHSLGTVRTKLIWPVIAGLAIAAGVAVGG